MLKTIYTENELRNKLSNYANERIESIACDGVQIQIIFKEGYATSFLSSDSCDTEIYFNSIASMKEACKKAYLDEGQKNLEKAKAKEEQEQQQEEKKEDNNMKDIVKKYVNIEEKEEHVKMYYQDLKEKVNELVEMVSNWTDLGWWSEWSTNPYMQQGAGFAVTDVYFFAEKVVEMDKSEALTVLAIMKDLFENCLSETPIELTYFWNAFDRISDQVPSFGDERESSRNLEQTQAPTEQQTETKEIEPVATVAPGEVEETKQEESEDKKEELPNLENDSQEITSLRLDLTDSERDAIHYLYELEKDRYNGKEWTDKEKVQAQKALDTLTYLGILDTFPNLKDFNPQLEDLDRFKFYKSESFYDGGYLPTAKAIDFLELSYDEIVEQDKVMALMQIPLNVLQVTDFIEVLPNDILRVHLKHGFQYQGRSFIDATVGEYQAYSIEDETQIEQIQIFDLDIEQELKEQEGFNGLNEYEKVKSRIKDLVRLVR